MSKENPIKMLWTITSSSVLPGRCTPGEGSNFDISGLAGSVGDKTGVHHGTFHKASTGTAKSNFMAEAETIIGTAKV